MKTSCKHVVRFVSAILTAFALVVLGLLPAHADFAEKFGVQASTSAEGPGLGKLIISAPLMAKAPVTLTIAGGTFADGKTSEDVTLIQTVTTERGYICTSAATVITVSTLAVKGGAFFTVPAPCGEIVVPPPVDPVWKQTASITPGAAGSGLATVVYNNEGSTVSGGFYLTVNGGGPISQKVLVTRTSSSFLFQGKPGDVLRVYGTKDGTGQPTLLTDPPVTLPKAVVVPPAVVWNQTAEIIPGPAGSGNADVLFKNIGSSRSGGFYVTINGGQPTSVTSVAAGKTHSIPIHGKPGDVIRVYGTKDGTGQPTLLTDPPVTLPKAAVVAPPIKKPVPPNATPVPAPVKKPVATPVTPAGGQPVTPAKTNVWAGAPLAKMKSAPADNTWKRPTFDTAAGADQSQANLAVTYGYFAIAAIGAVVIAASVFIRRRARQ